MSNHISPDGFIRSCRTENCDLDQVSIETKKVVDANSEIFAAMTPTERKKYIKDVQYKLENTETSKIIAKIKTAYRETACILGLLSKKGQGTRAILASSSKEYLDMVLDTQVDLRESEKRALESVSWERGYMPAEVKETILNNYKLGKKIRGFYYYHRDTPIDPDTVKWVGDDTSYAPADMLVNNEKWSLKEKSSIIKNQSAATFLNILTNSDDYGRGFHLLNELAPEENLQGLQKIVSHYNADNPETAYPEFKDYSEWKSQPKSEQKKLSRYIQSKDRTPEFKRELEEIKTRINEKAGDNLLKRINNAHEVDAGELLGSDVDYFYSKFDHNGDMFAGYVPNKETISKHVKVKAIWYTAGSQLNIIIKYVNTRAEEFLTITEIRYSHGQFNGIPEAKMKTYSGDFVAFLDTGAYPKKPKAQE